jgi:hypothetical protein
VGKADVFLLPHHPPLSFLNPINKGLNSPWLRYESQSSARWSILYVVALVPASINPFLFPLHRLHFRVFSILCLYWHRMCNITRISHSQCRHIIEDVTVCKKTWKLLSQCCGRKLRVMEFLKTGECVGCRERAVDGALRALGLL